MVDEQHVLLVDVGNTAIKYTLLPNACEPPHLASSVTQLHQFIDAQPKITHIYLSNVASPEITASLEDYCQRQNIAISVACTRSQDFGITNSYADVTTMGVDRWLAMVAAKAITNKPFCVIHVGTAITCDFVVEGLHLGGWISPGFQVMREAVVQRTKKVSADLSIPEALTLGKDTPGCVAMGCLAAVRGVYLSAVDYLSSKQNDYAIVLGGGDKKLLTFADHGDSIHAANLVVQGLARYAKRDFFA